MLNPPYLLDTGAPGERDRLAAIESTHDPATRDHLRRLGAGPGSRVLLAGAGGGSFLPWLAELVGADGRVLAVDVDPRHLWPVADRYANVEVRQHDLLTDRLPVDEFDIVHTRLVLIHFPQRDRILDDLVAAVRPGGWLLIEDYDWRSYGPSEPNTMAEQQINAMATFLARAGFDPYLGRRLPSMLRRRGLADVGASGAVTTLRGAGSRLETIYRGSFAQLAPQAVAAGLLSPEHVPAFDERMADPDYDMTSQTMVSAWGRRVEETAWRS